MFAFFGGRSRVATRWYQAIVAQSRDPWFYQVAGVPDSLDGRFEVMVLHMAIFHGALSDLPGTRAYRQRLDEVFVDSLDNQLRELGVSDSGIARKMTKMAEHYYGRQVSYLKALGHNDEPGLSQAITRNLLVAQTGEAQTGEAQISHDQEVVDQEVVDRGLANGLSRYGIESATRLAAQLKATGLDKTSPAQLAAGWAPLSQA